MARNVTIIAFLLTVSVACTQEEQIVRSFPRIKTATEIAVDNTGAKFGGEVISFGESPIIDHGFEWREGEVVPDRIQLGKLSAIAFTQYVTRGLEKSIRYEVRAYVKTDKLTSYGEWIPFVAEGSVGPVVKSVTPTTGTWGDTIIVKGTGFSFRKQYLSVNFGLYSSVILEQTDSMAKAIIPTDFVEGITTPVIVKVGGYSSSLAGPTFTFRAPVISSVSPPTVKDGTLIVVTGKYFHLKNTLVKLGTNEIFPNVTSRTRLDFRVPDSTPTGPLTITVTTPAGSTSVPSAVTHN